jgi:hypothetical protein
MTSPNVTEAFYQVDEETAVSWETMRVPGLCAVVWLGDHDYYHLHDVRFTITAGKVSWVQYAFAEECLLDGC